MALLRSSVFLLISCAVLTQTLAAFIHTEQIRDKQIRDGEFQRLSDQQIRDGDFQRLSDQPWPTPDGEFQRQQIRDEQIRDEQIRDEQIRDEQIRDEQIR